MPFNIPIPYPFVNGNRCDYSSVVVDVAGDKFNGVKSINYGHGLDPGIVRGNRAQVIGTSRGKYDAEADIELYLAEYRAFIAKLALLGGTRAGYMEVKFQALISFTEGPLSELITDKLVGVRVKKVEHNQSEGNEPITVKCQLHVMSVIEGGLLPMAANQFLI